jgi:hypothetical protein
MGWREYIVNTTNKPMVLNAFSDILCCDSKILAILKEGLEHISRSTPLSNKKEHRDWNHLK